MGSGLNSFFVCLLLLVIQYIINLLLIISRHANEVSEAGIVFDLFLIILLFPPLEACMRCISGTAWSWTLIFLHKVDAAV